MTAAEIVLIAVKASIAGLTFGLGLRSKPEDILSFVERPGLLARSFLALNVVMPLFALAAIEAFALRRDLAGTLIALSLSPVPPLLPRKQASAHGDRSFAVGLLVVFAVLSIVWIPLAIEGLGLIAGRRFGVSAGAIAWIVATLIVVPLMLGIALRKFASEFARRIEPAVSLSAVAVLLLAALLIVAKTASGMLEQIGDGTILVLAAFVAVGLVAGHLLGGPHPQERTDLALAAACRHPGIALATAQTAFPNAPGVPALVAIYLIVNIVIGLPYIKWRGRHVAAKAGEAETG
jgi:bile acid:Na+ symporter, BASS family